ncbi:hypothetical protein Rhopal_002935-T1 [Rhodotorula paludigena]|uniref:Uncharacterized protein n=1 Tax=Rhodotorula paludigena TaxID=86838 RepID=A0AAV5GBV5_9BASI|nr:hypothetical protein Rhopal_002935-T1 [Rhodotorula paludigena]
MNTRLSSEQEKKLRLSVQAAIGGYSGPIGATPVEGLDLERTRRKRKRQPRGGEKKPCPVIVLDDTDDDERVLHKMDRKAKIQRTASRSVGPATFAPARPPALAPRTSFPPPPPPKHSREYSLDMSFTLSIPSGNRSPTVELGEIKICRVRETPPARALQQALAELSEELRRPGGLFAMRHSPVSGPSRERGSGGGAGGVGFA